MKYNSLQQAVIGVLQEKKIKHPNQQVLDVHEPEKDELTAADFKKLRAGKKANEELTLEDFITNELDLLESLLESDHLDEGILDTIKKKASNLEDKIKGNFRPKRNDTNLDRVKNVLGRVEDKIKGNFRPKRNDTNMDRIKNAASTVKTHAIRAASKVGLASRFHPALRKEEFTLDDFTYEELEEFLQSEEAQQLDELSYDTLNSYMKKKRKQIGKATVGDADRLRGTPKGEKLDKDVSNYRKAWAKRDMKEDVEPVQETTILHDSFNVELKDSYTFGDFLTAAKKLFGEEQAIEVANTAFQDQDLEIFVEEISHSAVEDRVKAHMKAGHKVSMPKYSTRDGKPRAEYVVTDKDSGVRRKYIHQGNVTKMENMGARGKRDEK